MIKNYYYLIVGVLAILFAFTHAINGQTTVLPVLNVDTIDINTRTVFFYVWHIITIENFIFGMAFIFMAFYKDLSKVRFAAWMIGIIMIARWIVISGSMVFKNKIGLGDILIDTIAIMIVVVLIILGTRVKNKISE
ncbi:MAG: hypothetical protein M0R21_04110 [Lentimicrobiaceae bacterium]|nr:hypothetical protein [Lentimicrobiaceae bacterium]